METAEASARASAWALAIRARCCTLAYSGTAIAARMPMIATTIRSSIRVKPRCPPSVLFLYQIAFMCPSCPSLCGRTDRQTEQETCPNIGERPVQGKRIVPRYRFGIESAEDGQFLTAP